MATGKTAATFKAKKDIKIEDPAKDINIEKGEQVKLITKMESTCFIEVRKKSIWVEKEAFEKIEKYLDKIEKNDKIHLDEKRSRKTV